MTVEQLTLTQEVFNTLYPVTMDDQTLREIATLYQGGETIPNALLEKIEEVYGL